MKTIITYFLLWTTISVFAQKNKVTELISYRVSIHLDTLTQPTMKDRYLSHWEFNQNWYKDKIDYVRRSEFTKNLHEKICNGKITALEPFYELKGFTPYFEKLDPNKAKLIGTDSIYSVVYDNLPPYNAHDTIYVIHFNPDDIVQLEFMEIWTYSKHGMKIQKKLIAYAPVRRKFISTTGEYIGVSTMYWIPIKRRYLKITD